MDSRNLIINDGYFGGIRNNGYSGMVSISRTQPRGMRTSLPSVSELAPSWDILNDYKKGKIGEKEYIDRFTKEMEERISKEGLSEDAARLEVLEKLAKYAGDDNTVTLMCWEKPDEFCHRHAVRVWLEGRSLALIRDNWKERTAESAERGWKSGDDSLYVIKLTLPDSVITVSGISAPSYEKALDEAMEKAITDEMLKTLRPGDVKGELAGLYKTEEEFEKAGLEKGVMQEKTAPVEKMPDIAEKKTDEKNSALKAEEKEISFEEAAKSASARLRQIDRAETKSEKSTDNRENDDVDIDIRGKFGKKPYRKELNSFPLEKLMESRITLADGKTVPLASDRKAVDMLRVFLASTGVTADPYQFSKTRSGGYEMNSNRLIIAGAAYRSGILKSAFIDQDMKDYPAKGEYRDQDESLSVDRRVQEAISYWGDVLKTIGYEPSVLSLSDLYDKEEASEKGMGDGFVYDDATGNRLYQKYEVNRIHNMVNPLAISKLHDALSTDLDLNGVNHTWDKKQSYTVELSGKDAGDHNLPSALHMNGVYSTYVLMNALSKLEYIHDYRKSRETEKIPSPSSALKESDKFIDECLAVINRTITPLIRKNSSINRAVLASAFDGEKVDSAFLELYRKNGGKEGLSDDENDRILSLSAEEYVEGVFRKGIINRENWRLLSQMFEKSGVSLNWLDGKYIKAFTEKTADFMKDDDVRAYYSSTVRDESLHEKIRAKMEMAMNAVNESFDGKASPFWFDRAAEEYIRFDGKIPDNRVFDGNAEAMVMSFVSYRGNRDELEKALRLGDDAETVRALRGNVEKSLAAMPYPAAAPFLHFSEKDYLSCPSLSLTKMNDGSVYFYIPGNTAFNTFSSMRRDLFRNAGEEGRTDAAPVGYFANSVEYRNGQAVVKSLLPVWNRKRLELYSSLLLKGGKDFHDAVLCEVEKIAKNPEELKKYASSVYFAADTGKYSAMVKNFNDLRGEICSQYRNPSDEGVKKAAAVSLVEMVRFQDPFDIGIQKRKPLDSSLDFYPSDRVLEDSRNYLSIAAGVDIPSLVRGALNDRGRTFTKDEKTVDLFYNEKAERLAKEREREVLVR